MAQPQDPSDPSATAPGGPGHVELVIRTASSVVVGRLAPREAVTILATQTQRALGVAGDLARGDPAKARDYATILRSLEVALATGPGAPGGDLTAVREDLVRVARALEAP